MSSSPVSHSVGTFSVRSTPAGRRAVAARLERSPAAHRLRHETHFAAAEMIDERAEIARIVVRVRTAGRRTRGRKAAVREGHAGVAAAEMRHLLPPAQMIAAKPVREHQQRTLAGYFIVEPAIGPVEIAAFHRTVLR